MSVVTHTLDSSQWETGVDQLLACLNPWLIQYWQTCLVAVMNEPYYKPAESAQDYHQIQFAHGYFNSALHELAHWCIAGAQRRTLPDFGYWYEPDGRTVAQQHLFEKVEVKPQAVEWHFAVACRRRFRVSVDNLSGEPTDSQPFKDAVAAQAQHYLNEGLPSRAASIVDLLRNTFGGKSIAQFEFDQ